MITALEPWPDDAEAIPEMRTYDSFQAMAEDLNITIQHARRLVVSGKPTRGQFAGWVFRDSELTKRSASGEETRGRPAQTVRATLPNGVFRVFDSVQDAAEAFGLSVHSIYDVAKSGPRTRGKIAGVTIEIGD